MILRLVKSIDTERDDNVLYYFISGAKILEGGKWPHYDELVVWWTIGGTIEYTVVVSITTIRY